MAFVEDRSLKNANLTPMMRQYYELKQQAGDAILLFRMGDFYEIFGDDAELVAPKLQLVLTSRGDEQRIPFCGVPHHSARGHWLKLVKMGYKVAFADQVEDPKEAKGLVKRAITKFITPGSIDDLDGLDKENANYIIAFYEDPKTSQFAVCVADTSTGEMRLGNLTSQQSLLSVVQRYRPREILVRKFFVDEFKQLVSNYFQNESALVEMLPEAPLRDSAYQHECINRVCGEKALTSQPCGNVAGGLEVLAGLINYLESLLLKTNQFLTIRALSEPDTMVFDETAKRDLEIFETSRRRDADGSLFKEINRTLTPMGARLLKAYLNHPLVNQRKIAERQKAVASLVADSELLTEIRENLKGTPDIERLCTRLLAGLSQPSELALIRQTLQKVAWLAEHKVGNFEKFSYAIPLELLSRTIIESPLALGSGNGVLMSGIYSKLDELNDIAQNGTEKVAAYEAKLKEETQISSLKIKHHQSFGLLIEVTKSNLSRVPKDFIRKQTMVNNERFVTMELIALNEALVSATEEAVKWEADLYREFLLMLATYKHDYIEIAAALAQLDVTQSFAAKAKESNYCRPKAGSERIFLKGSRHPVVEHFVGSHNFINNDLNISEQQKHLLITGPNMAGKSTIMRQVAITALLHQIGSFVPAETAELPVFDRIFTRVGASDDLSQGKSTFLVEMSEAAQILRQATSNSLVIIDEVGRGTSTQDGLAIASAILEALAAKLNCWSFFATHYHELVEFTTKLPNIRPVKTAVSEKAGEVIFTHQIVDGASESSYGIEVAKIAGIPEEVIARAKELLLLHAPTSRVISMETVQTSRIGAIALAEFPDNHLQKISQRLESLKIHRTTPLQALNILNDLKAMLESREGSGLFD